MCTQWPVHAACMYVCAGVRYNIGEETIRTYVSDPTQLINNTLRLLNNKASTWADIGTTAMYNVHDTRVRGCVGYFHTTYIHTYLGLALLQSDPVWNHTVDTDWLN